MPSACGRRPACDSDDNCPMCAATVVLASYSTEHASDPTQLLIAHLRTRTIDLCPLPRRGLHFMAWCVQTNSGQLTSTVYIWARATPGTDKRVTAWQHVFPGAHIEPMLAGQWLSALTARAQEGGLFCSPAKVSLSRGGRLVGISGGTPVLDIEDHIRQLTPSPPHQHLPWSQAALGAQGNCRGPQSAQSVHAQTTCNGAHGASSKLCTETPAFRTVTTPLCVLTTSRRQHSPPCCAALHRQDPLPPTPKNVRPRL